MHLLLIIIVLVIAFPPLASFVGSIVRLVIWLIVVATVLAMVSVSIG